LASERSEPDTIRGNEWKSEIYAYIYTVYTRDVLFWYSDGERASLETLFYIRRVKHQKQVAI